MGKAIRVAVAATATTTAPTEEANAALKEVVEEVAEITTIPSAATGSIKLLKKGVSNDEISG